MKKNNNNRIDGIKPRTRKLKPQTKVGSAVKKKKSKRTEHNTVVKKRTKKESSETYQGNKSVVRKVLIRIGIPFVTAVIFSIIVLNQLDSAVIRVSPHREVVDIKKTITAKKEPITGELAFSIIAFSESASASLAPDTQEASREKASGAIRIFNDYSTSPQRLSPLTRFEAVDGKIFKLGEEGIVIPGKTGDQPGEVLATVYADQAGAEYNIDVTDFSVPGFLEIGMDEKYTNIYALSTAPFTGGLSGLQPSISPELKQQQSRDLEMKVQTVLQERLLSEKTPEMLLVENSASIIFKEPEYTVEAGSGELKVTGSIYALLVNKEELGNYLSESEVQKEEGATANLSSDTNLIPVYTGSGPINYGTISEADISIDNQALFIWDIDKQQVAKTFSYTSKKNISNTADQLQSIGSLRLTNHPRWRDMLPKDSDDIKVKIIE